MERSAATRLTVRVAGMTCPACENRVARALRAVPGVVAVTASARRGTATIDADGAPPAAAIASAIDRAGYRVVAGRPAPWLTRSGRVWRDVALGVGLFAVLVLAVYLSGVSGVLDRLGNSVSVGSLLLVVLIGVAASLSTCMALVGGLVIGLSASYAASHPGASARQLMHPQWFFHLGRIVGFALLGALVGAIGSVIALSGVGLAIAMVAVALAMVWVGIRLTGISPRLAAWSPALPGAAARWIERSEVRGYRPLRAVAAGAGSFFLPCGFTQAVQVYALATGSPLQAGLIMALFAAGTAPGLLGAGALASLARGPRTHTVLRMLGVVVIGFALVTAIGGVRAMAPTHSAGAAQTAAPSDNVTLEAGVQVVRTTQVADGYAPADTTIYAGIPVRWVIDSTAVSCATALNLDTLGLGQATLAPGENMLEFTMAEPGTYKFSCQMGMYWGSFTVIESPT